MAKEIIALIGSGGKSTALQVLGAQAPGPVLLTTTTHIFPVSPSHCSRCLVNPEEAELVSVLEGDAIVCAGRTAQQGKLQPLPPDVLSAGIQAAHTVIYEGDGAKMHPLKLHRPGEPVILPETTAVLVVAGLSALGRPIGETIHRYDRNPHWVPEQAIGLQELFHCILETVCSAGVPRERIRIFLNQADACLDPAVPETLCRRLQQQGLAARFGSLREHPPGLYDWVIAKEIDDGTDHNG